VIGRIVADTVEETLDPMLAKKFAVDRNSIRVGLSRASAVEELDIKSLCSPQDLLSGVHGT